METCETCGQTATARKHPCRFEKGCSCWRSIPCKPWPGYTPEAQRYEIATRFDRNGMEIVR